jgi:hypothetical protein
LLGSLSQGGVFEKLQAGDIFALPSMTDSQGASDVFPTVIIEAMSAARPVISTRLAGIPELVVHEETGFLVRSGDMIALVEALEQLIRNPELRLRYGRAGHMRIEQHFRIEQTIRPLLELLQRTCIAPPKPQTAPGIRQIAYLIDRWPDKNLPLIERELEEMNRRNISIVPFVCELDSAARLTRVMERIASRLEFLPDAMVLEAEWRANPALTQKLEEHRAQETERVPDKVFLRQARFALVLRRLLLEKNVSHIHATTSRALVCALILQEFVDVTVSATIERRPKLPQNWIRSALRRCEGGRLSDHKMLRSYDDSFLRDKAAFHSLPRKAVGLFGEKIGMDLTGGASFWQEWSELLKRWRRKETPDEFKASA